MDKVIDYKTPAGGLPDTMDVEAPLAEVIVAASRNSEYDCSPKKPLFDLKRSFAMSNGVSVASLRSLKPLIKEIAKIFHLSGDEVKTALADAKIQPAGQIRALKNTIRLLTIGIYEGFAGGNDFQLPGLEQRINFQEHPKARSFWYYHRRTALQQRLHQLTEEFDSAAPDSQEKGNADDQVVETTADLTELEQAASRNGFTISVRCPLWPQQNR